MTARKARANGAQFVLVALLVLVLSGCSETVLSVSDNVRGTVSDTLSGAIAPVRGAIDEAARRANEVGEGINDVTGGIQKVRGALSGSGATW